MLEATASSQASFVGLGAARTLARSVDWSATPIGPVQRWPSVLRAAVRLCLASPTPMGVWAGPDFTLIHNDAYAMVLGDRARWAQGKPGREVWGDLWDAIAPELGQVVRTGLAARREGPLFTSGHDPSGETAPFAFTLTPLQAEDGRCVGVLDVCERIRRAAGAPADADDLAAAPAPGRAGRQELLSRLTDALRPVRERAAIQGSVCALLAEHLRADRVHCAEAHADEGLVVVPPDFARPGLTGLTGRHPLAGLAEALPALGAGGTLVVTDAGRSPLLPERARAACRAQGMGAFVAAALVRDGKPGWILFAASSAPRAWAAEEVALVREVADRAGVALEWARAAQAAHESDQRKTEFLAVLSHELRNPLAPIRNSLYLLSRLPEGSEHSARAREVLHRQTEHLARLVDDLLDITRISRGKIELRRKLLDLREVVRRTTDDLRTTFEARGLVLRVEPGPGPAWVDGDAVRLSQALANLLQNAIKFTPAEGTVTVGLSSADGRVRLSVRDTGIGIEPADLERMFQPFTQAAQGLARAQGGLGLGLALVKGLVELHGGTVRASSRGLGQGAEFVATLPLVRPEAAASEGLEAAPGAAPRDILVIEDNGDAAQMLADVLALKGHRVRVAHDGRAGLALLHERRPNFVLCDIGLPDMSGYELAKTVRADASLADTRLIALTGYALPEDRDAAAAAGFDAHLSKPPPLDRLQALLRGG